MFSWEVYFKSAISESGIELYQIEVISRYLAHWYAKKIWGWEAKFECPKTLRDQPFHTHGNVKLEE